MHITAQKREKTKKKTSIVLPELSNQEPSTANLVVRLYVNFHQFGLMWMKFTNNSHEYGQLFSFNSTQCIISNFRSLALLQLSLLVTSCVTIISICFTMNQNNNWSLIFICCNQIVPKSQRSFCTKRNKSAPTFSTKSLVYGTHIWTMKWTTKFDHVIIAIWVTLISYRLENFRNLLSVTAIIIWQALLWLATSVSKIKRYCPLEIAH